jgi:3-oxoacyl-[acyl-carrier-protein] synthase III
MRYERVYLEAIGYELAPNVVSSASLEARLAPLYASLRLQPGQVEALTGIRERRFWDPGVRLAHAAARAASGALQLADFPVANVGALMYAGVCRDGYEPATACAVGAVLGTSSSCAIMDISNACLGVLNAALMVANMIEAGQVEAGLVVSCESSREITDATISSMLANPTMDAFRLGLATLTGGSGAVAWLLTNGRRTGKRRHRLRGAAHRSALAHHGLCWWAPDATAPGGQRMETDAAEVLKQGVALGCETWRAFLSELGWGTEDVARVICHQVGAGHRQTMLRALEIPTDRDFSNYEYLGNMGTVSLPVAAAMADERGVLPEGGQVAFLGIGSGLNCLMLGWEWGCA